MLFQLFINASQNNNFKNHQDTIPKHTSAVHKAVPIKLISKLDYIISIFKVDVCS